MTDNCREPMMKQTQEQMIKVNIHIQLLEVKLTQSSFLLSVSWSVCHNFCRNFLKGLEVLIPCSYRSTCLLGAKHFYNWSRSILFSFCVLSSNVLDVK